MSFNFCENIQAHVFFKVHPPVFQTALKQCKLFTVRNYITKQIPVRVLLSVASFSQAASNSIAPVGTTMVVVTEEELEQMRRLNGEVVDRETVMAYNEVDGSDQIEEDEDEEAVLDEIDNEIGDKSEQKAGD